MQKDAQEEGKYIGTFEFFKNGKESPAWNTGSSLEIIDEFKKALAFFLSEEKPSLAVLGGIRFSIHIDDEIWSVSVLKGQKVCIKNDEKTFIDDGDASLKKAMDDLIGVICIVQHLNGFNKYNKKENQSVDSIDLKNDSGKTIKIENKHFFLYKKCPPDLLTHSVEMLGSYKTTFKITCYDDQKDNDVELISEKGDHKWFSSKYQNDKPFSFVPFSYSGGETIQSMTSNLLEEYCENEMAFAEKEGEQYGFRALIDLIEQDKDKRSLVFRGQNNASWKLRSSFWRKDFEESEKDVRYNSLFCKICSNFSSKLNIKNLSTPKKMQLFSLLQHFGASTPLIDFTASLDIALFFAFDLPPTSKTKKVAIYAVDVGKMHSITIAKKTLVNPIDLQKLTRNHFGIGNDFNLDLPNGSLIEPSEFWDLRLSRQQALFMWEGFSDGEKRENEFFDFLGTRSKFDPKPQKGTMVKFILPIQEREEVLNYLRGKEITRDFLFPNMEKIARETESDFLNEVLYKK